MAVQGYSVGMLLRNFCSLRGSSKNLTNKIGRCLSTYAIQFDSLGDPLKVAERREVQLPGEG